ncbi:hypothetical protein LOAG_10627 [Loa loa]|uniref:Uncharacterized protein n=1 Tax=Loa loa TaxID=7209 RepID=A0A1S0TPJ1_LOALO|nr:hypothetical protein LOAG_10627 [Loa loa]EFO17871.1 hypothetical protein LOAG_10627 [Loa loa]
MVNFKDEKEENIHGEKFQKISIVETSGKLSQWKLPENTRTEKSRKYLPWKIQENILGRFQEKSTMKNSTKNLQRKFQKKFSMENSTKDPIVENPRKYSLRKILGKSWREIAEKVRNVQSRQISMENTGSCFHAYYD